MAAKIRKGDNVAVIAGKDKGKTGEVIAVLPAEGRVKVRGVNLVKKHQRQTPMQQGGIVEIEAALDLSNVAIVDPKTNKPTRVGFRTLEDGRKVRFAKASGELIDQ